MHSLRWLPRLATLTASLGLLLVVESVALASEPPSSSLPDDVVGPPPPPEVRVHVTSKVPAKLQRLPPGGLWWYDVCDAPCDRPQPLSGDYRVINGMGNASEPVQLVASGPEQQMEIVYHAGSAGGLIGGSLMLTVGIIGLAVGTLVVAGGVASVASSANCNERDPSFCPDPEIGRVILLLGAVALNLGTGLTIGGFLLVKKSTATAAAKTTYVREPTWLGPRNGASARPSMTAPLTFSF